MKIDTEGTYTLRYTAEDECGNVTTEDRTVNAINITYSTVLFTDGTFIINEKSTDRAANIALHGAVTNEYIPYDPNGSQGYLSRYEFGNASVRPWNAQSGSILSVELGTDISPSNTAYWFANFSNCTSIDLDKLDTSAVTTMGSMFFHCDSLPSIDVTNFDTQNVTDMSSMFEYCKELTSLDVTNFDTSKVTTMERMFAFCKGLASIDLSNFNTQAVTTMSAMFYASDALQSLDLSSFLTPALKNMSEMFCHCSGLVTIDMSNFSSNKIENMYNTFNGCTKLQTIYAATNFQGMYATQYRSTFDNCSRNLVGGAGTVWSGTNATSVYARVDGGTSKPGYFTAKS